MTCWFCGVEEEAEGKAYEGERYWDVMQNPADTEEAVSFNKKLVVVPRCASCKHRQAKAKRANIFAVISLVLAITAGIFGVLKVVDGYIWGIALGFFAAMIIEFLTIRHHAMKGIKSEAAARKKNEEVCEFLSRGYEFGRAPKQHKVAETIIEED